VNQAAVAMQMAALTLPLWESRSPSEAKASGVGVAV
jgi:hypothetical protein